MTEIHNPENKQHINEIYAIVSRDKNGNEGIIAVRLDESSFTVFPCICSEKSNIETFKRIVLLEKDRIPSSMSLRVIKFTSREETEVL